MDRRTLAIIGLALLALLAILGLRAMRAPAPPPPPPPAPAVDAKATSLFAVESGAAQGPVFSPDGRLVAFTVTRAFGVVELHAVDRTTGVDRAVAPDGLPPDPAAHEPPGAGGRWREMRRPVWVPGGSGKPELVFEGVLARHQERRLYRCTWDAPRATPVDAAKGDDGQQAAVSPSGQVLAWVASSNGLSRIQVWEAARHNAAARPLDAIAGDESAPRFLPSGKALVYARTVAGDEDVVLSPIAPGDDAVIAGGPGQQAWPAPLADGSTAFYASADGSTWDLDVAPAHAGEVRTVARGVAAPSTAPSASPDGRWVAWVRADDDRVWLGRVDGSGATPLRTALEKPGDPAFGAADGRVWLAVVAGPPTARGLYLVDVTEALAAPPMQADDGFAPPAATEAPVATSP